jgi:integrase
MAKVRIRPDNGMLFLDFYYRGVRCREQTALPETAENLKKVQTFLNRILKDIAQGTFDYAAVFPGSPRAAQFATSTVGPISALSANGAASDGQTPRPSTQLFTDFAELWFLEMSPQWRRLHRSCVREVLNKNLLPTFGPRPVGEVTKAEVLAFRAQIAQLPGRKGTLGNARINKIMCFLRQILNEAADRFEVTPAFRGVKPLKQKKTDVQPFSLDEVNRILEAVRADYRNYLATRFFTGMRTGEINGLQWKYVDLERNLILVRETVVAGEVEDDAKNQSSVRDIPMQPMVREAILAQQRVRDPAVPWVFPSREGGPIDAHNFTNRVWYPLLRYLELEKRRPYQTRHTAATLMLASGENPEWIARTLGHTNTDMLFRVYSRYVPNLTRQDGRAFAGLINSRLVDQGRATAPMTPADLDTMSPEQLRAALANLLNTGPRPGKEARDRDS